LRHYGNSYITEKKHKKVFDPLGLEGFELTERLNSILINLMGCCGRIWFKETRKKNPDQSIINKYDEISTEARNVRNDPNSWGYYDTMEELIKKYSPIIKAALKFEKETYSYAANKVAVVTV
jgi:hypothetical protein